MKFKYFVILIISGGAGAVGTSYYDFNYVNHRYVSIPGRISICGYQRCIDGVLHLYFGDQLDSKTYEDGTNIPCEYIIMTGKEFKAMADE